MFISKGDKVLNRYIYMCDLYIYEKTKRTQLGLVGSEIKVGIGENANDRVNQFGNAADVFSGQIVRVIRLSSKEDARRAETETLKYFDEYRQLRENGSKSEVLSTTSNQEHEHLLWSLKHHVKKYENLVPMQPPPAVVDEEPTVCKKRYKKAAQAAKNGEGIIFCEAVRLPNSYGRNDCLRNHPLDETNKENMEMWIRELEWIKHIYKDKFTYKTGTRMTDPTDGNGNLSAYIKHCLKRVPM
tara:strand:- start:12878 stop:13603 length:726 start_codon:yes stop_codon:yes gene_type:complete